MQLYDYQTNLVGKLRDAMRSSSRVLAVSPTGSGKTVMFSYIASRARERGKRIGIFAHRAELLEQISSALRAFKIPHGVIGAGTNPDMRHRVFVCSAQAYARRVPQMPRFDLVVIDEAHHCTTGSTWHRCLTHSPDARVLGVTATPERLDGRGLAETFDSMVMGPTVRSLIDIGRLSDYRLFAPGALDLSGVHTLAGDYNKGELNVAVDKPSITGDAVKHYRKHLNGAPSAVFCVSIAHAHHVAEEFRAQGFTAAAIDGKMDKGERRKIVGDFKRGALNLITSAEILSEGFDVPGMHGAILLRPTKSLALYLQQVGRALRKAPGKDKATIIDHVGNSNDDTGHGLPCQDREWSLDGRAKAKGPAEVSAYRECRKCFARVPLTRRECPECGTVFPVTVREVEQVDGELQEVDVAEVRAKKPPSPQMKAQGRARSLEALTDLFRRQTQEKLGRPLDADEMARQARRAQHIIDARMRKHG